MSLQFVFGPSGSGKSYYLYHHVIEESIKHPEQNYLVLVPDQFTMQTQKDLVTMHPNHGIMNIDILSFGRLAYRVFEETGGGRLPVLDDEGKNLILRRIAGQYEAKLRLLKGNMKKLGYISEVKSVISEFDQYDIGIEEIRKLMDQAGEESRLYYKLHDIAILYEGFYQYLEEQFITKEELLDVLCLEIDKSEILKNSTVVLDGFTGFTPVQSRLLTKLMTHCRKVMVTVTLDEKENPYAYHGPYQMFALSKQMVTSLIQGAKEASVLIEAPVTLYQNILPRFQNSPELGFLERHLFRYDQKNYGEMCSQIALHVARNPKEEAYAAAGRVRNLVREHGLRYRDIGLIVSNMDTYADYLEAAFQDYQIPSFMDHKRSILLNSFVEYIRSILNMVEQQFSYESVFRYLRTNLTGISLADVDSLENYVTALGIRGYKRWQERWTRKTEEMERVAIGKAGILPDDSEEEKQRKLHVCLEEELDHLNHLRVQFVENIDDLVFVLKQRKKSVKDMTLALYTFVEKEQLQARIMQKEAAFSQAGELALAKEYEQIYRILMELFDKLVSLLGEEEVSLEEYCKLLDAGLEEAKVGVIPPSPDQVVVGDVERTRLKDIRALIFLGANDTLLPGNLSRNGLLSERDREVFKAEKLSLAPGGKERIYVQKFYLYMNLTKPSEYLDVYYSKVSSDGKAVRPAYLVQELHKLYPQLKLQDEEEKTLLEKEWNGEMGFDYLTAALTKVKDGEEIPEGFKELFRWYLAHPEWQQKVEKLLDAGFYVRRMDGMTMEIAKQLYGEHFQKSISRMERFMACSFAHFLTYGLGLKEKQEFEFQAVDLGNICHKALELYSKKLYEEGLSWESLDPDSQEAYLSEAVEIAIADYGASVLYDNARNEHMIVRVNEMLRRTVWALTRQLSAGDFSPSEYELRFANGKIDRVDTCIDEDKIYVKVTDYKTGSKEFDVNLLYHGLQLQLMVYMDAALKHAKKKYKGKEAIPAGVFYYRIKDSFVERGGKEPELEILKELKVDGIIPDNDSVISHLDRNIQGESLVIPLAYTKKGGYTAASKVVSEYGFEAMMQHALKKVEEANKRILEGEAKAYPYQKGEETGCDYCAYRHICGFDRRIEGYDYHKLEVLKKEDMIARIQQENQKGGS
ncbi:MAG: exodeoxyribonuclease V subunit gamma [Dorea sp.]|nr:exodeoxyribonuclease V subunit gamma [Dorea sp.]